MAKRTEAEKEQAKLTKAQRTAAHLQRISERRQRSAQAMAEGPDVYAKRIVASWLQVPCIHFWYSLLYMICDYIFSGHIIVKNWQKLLVKAGYVSEGALGVAGVWALINHVAIIHNLLAGNPLTRQIIDPMNGFMMGSFTLIPDLILASAILMTVNRWGDCKSTEGRGAAVLWALTYSACTATFFGLTIYTLSTVGSVASSGDITKVVYASGTELQIRVISSFLYGLSEIVYAYTHKGYKATLPVPQPTPAPAPQIDVQQIISDAVNAATKVVADVATEQKGMINDLSQRLENATNLQRVQHAGLLAQVQQKPAATIDTDAVATIVMQRLEMQLQNLLQQYTTVAPATDPQITAIPGSRQQALLDAPKPREKKSAQERFPSNITPLQQRVTGKKALIFSFLDEDPSLEPVELAKLAECDRTLAWKHRNAWMKARNIVSDQPEAETPDEDGNGEENENLATQEDEVEQSVG